LAIRFYYELIQPGIDESREKPNRKPESPLIIKENPKSFQSPSFEANFKHSSIKPDPSTKTTSQKGLNEKWNVTLNDLANEIKVRHYSPKTLKSYSLWVRKLQYFCKSKDPVELSTTDVKEFLTFLAVKQKVSASSQNQAFNALLFLFRHILDKKPRRY
jgi:hypothetical protein